jgi:glycosyltransferase involved in cell wall biosynthesis
VKQEAISKSGSGICMVGAFPPPVHGMSVINAGLYERVRSRGAAPVVLNLAPASLSRTLFNRLGRCRSVAKALLRYLREVLAGRGTTLYVGLSGGWGQLYEALFVAIGRVRGARVFLHHHSFAYLDRRSMPTRLLAQLGGSSATHIVLCEGQRRELRRYYPTVLQTRVMSNAAIMECIGTGNQTRSRVTRIGFLGNISREKGIGEVVAVAERLANRSSGLEVYIAGPFENAHVEKTVQSAVARLNMTYLGPRYGVEKEAFWELIDVLLFPSKYSNETAPLVVYEAMAHAVPVIAWERGCLSEMVSPGAGILVPREEDFVAVAVEQLLAWQRDPAVFTEVSKAAAKQFNLQREKHGDSLERLLDEFCPRRPACSYSHTDRVSSY